MKTTTFQKLLVLATMFSLTSCVYLSGDDSPSSSTSDTSEDDSSSQISESSSDSSSDSPSSSTSDTSEDDSSSQISESSSDSSSDSSSSSTSDWTVNVEFAQQLHNQMLEDHTTYTNYGDLRYMYVCSDPDPDNEGYILDFYTKQSMNGTWDSGLTYNREHVWCASLSNNLWNSHKNSDVSGGTDLLHIRPVSSSLNSARGKKPFGVVTTATKTDASGKYDEHSYEPLDISKGDVARELMYLYVHYGTQYGGKTNSYTGTLDITSIVYTSEGTEEAAFKLLLEWNELDPVASTEITLNDYAETVQGNRNPFIDHPEYATTIWGQTSN